MTTALSYTEILNDVYDSSTHALKTTGSGSSSGGGGGAGDASAANQSTQITLAGTANTSLGSIDTKTPALGQTTMAGSVPITIASNQSAIPVSNSTLPLPSGAATAANQTTAQTTLATLLTQSDFDTKAALLSTAAKQDTGNTSLSSIDDKLSSLGQKPFTASVPVIMASGYNQPILPVNFVASGTAAVLNADIVSQMDASNYRGGTLQLTGTWSGTVQIQVSLDAGNNWVSVFKSDLIGTSVNINSTANGIYQFNIPPGSTLLRIRATSYSSGTILGVLALSTVAVPMSQYVVLSTGSGAASVNTTIDNSNIGTTLGTTSVQLVFSPAGGTNGVKLVRNVEVFKTVTATAAGSTTLWTPAAGKKFRLMRFRIETTADVASSGGAEIDAIFYDNLTALNMAHSFYAPAAAVTTGYGSIGTPWVDLGNGILSSGINSPLMINLSAALTSGKVRVIAVGTEE